MIELHRPDRPHKLSDEIEERLQNMVAAHKVKRYSNNGDHKLPFLKENDRVISDEGKIDALLREIERELKEQRMVSGDACYIDPRTGDLC